MPMPHFRNMKPIFSLYTSLFIVGLIFIGCDSNQNTERNQIPAINSKVVNNTEPTINKEAALNSAKKALQEKEYRRVIELTSPLLGTSAEINAIHSQAQSNLDRIRETEVNSAKISKNMADAEASLNELTLSKVSLDSLEKEELVARIDGFQDVALKLLEIESIKTPEGTDAKSKAYAKTLRKKLSSLQSKEFPLLRKALARHMAQRMWEHNIEIGVGGTGNSILEFTGGHFANNGNIKETQEASYDVLSKFRFKQTRYRWYKHANEYTYYKLDVPKDSEIRTE